MNILNRNRNRRKTSSSRMSTAADACETRSLLCAAALPVAELVTTDVEAPVESPETADAEFVEATSFEETPGLEVCTCFAAPFYAEVTSSEFDASIDGSVVEEVTFSEEELSRFAAGMFSMFSMMVGEDGSELPPENSEWQPELAVCTFGPELFDEDGVPVEYTSEVEFDPATYDLTSLEGWDPSWAFRGVVVDGVDPSLDSSQFDPTTEGTEEFVVDGSLDGLIPVEVDLDGDGIPDGYTWVSEDNLPKEEHFGSDVPEDGDSEVSAIYWFGINDSAGSEFDADGNPIYYMTGSPDGGEWYEEVTEDGEVKVTLEDTFDGEVTVIEPIGQVLFMNTLFATPMLDVPTVPIQMEASIAARSEGVPSIPELQNGPAGLPIVRIPVMRPQSSVFQPQTNSASTTSVQTQESTSTRTETPAVQQTPATPSSRIRGASVARLSRPASAPTTELQTLSPLLGEQPAEEANEDPVVPQQVEEAQTVVPDASTEQETVWVPTRERRSIDMFMSDFADDSYIG